MRKNNHKRKVYRGRQRTQYLDPNVIELPKHKDDDGTWTNVKLLPWWVEKALAGFVACLFTALTVVAILSDYPWWMSTWFAACAFALAGVYWRSKR